MDVLVLLIKIHLAVNGIDPYFVSSASVNMRT